MAREGEPGGDTWGKLPNLLRAGGDTWITGSYDPDAQSHLLGRGAGQALDARQPRHRRTKPRSIPAPRSRSIPTPASWPGTSSMCRANRSISTKSSSACWWMPAAQKLVFTIGKAGILWKLDRGTGKYSRHKETVFQNVFDHIDRKDRRGALPQRHRGAAEEAVGAGLPQHGRRPQLAGHELQPRRERTHHSAEPELHGDVGPRRGSERRLRRHAGRPPLLRNARIERQRRQAGGLRCRRR